MFSTIIAKGESPAMMQTTHRKLVLVLVFAALLFALVACDNLENCDLQMVAGGSQICEDARK